MNILDSSNVKVKLNGKYEWFIISLLLFLFIFKISETSKPRCICIGREVPTQLVTASSDRCRGWDECQMRFLRWEIYFD
jgi:hypothetical protein